VAHCALCRAGGIRSYQNEGVTRLGRLAQLGDDVATTDTCWGLSSASTLGRFESNADFMTDQFHSLADRLNRTAQVAYEAAIRWIEREKLDAIFLFNGRMDATRGILEAANFTGIPYVSVERTWFGDGLQLYPAENCLGLNSVGKLMCEWRDKPLTQMQALRAANHIASRFLGTNTKEWRAYNLTATETPWPIADGKRRILLVPGSRNEIWGHPDWVSSWSEATAAYDAIIERFGLSSSELVLRAHPNWGEKIGDADGHMSEKYYSDWAHKRGVLYIPSRDTRSTLDLISESDAIVVNGGSAALEAGILGKQVISISPSTYQHAGFQSDATSIEQLTKLTLNTELCDDVKAEEAAKIARYTLRYAYTMIYRIPQYVDYVRSISTTRYQYFEGADPSRLTDLIENGRLRADDKCYSADLNEEDLVLNMISEKGWGTLRKKIPDESNFLTPRFPIRRRLFFRPVDFLRDLFPRGDL
tara:strand:+ start:4748 stop:6169 length:1422 start_codon:yes stop_codon:yes gene_type:complete